MQLLPGYLLLTMALAYLASEVILRRRTVGGKGPLNFGTRPIVFTPLAIYLIAAVVLSTASWNILNLTSVLIVFALPMALGAAARGFRPDMHPAVPAVIAGALSLFGLFSVGAGYQG
ncbi:MAG TPA: hypothetical protein VJ976_00460 [Ornithinimicrobium sp.]|uniref:hypothetical protein n=1 Tax=Ornithinimicrobium sp. TaxID=1977084 RepID=UPI002B48A914|nr:hypothetical protein [Ornithinimicrobium sp.]HKJ10838.1 hypothetical protein [Ornithinimicrobium sp.]